eukprot:1390637-Amphidinium_carterae.1
MQLHCRGELDIPDGRTCARAKYGHLHGCTSARIDELQKYLGISLSTQATKGDEADTAKQVVERSGFHIAQHGIDWRSLCSSGGHLKSPIAAAGTLSWRRGASGHVGLC